jgi:hypothetical protein
MDEGTKKYIQGRSKAHSHASYGTKTAELVNAVDVVV